MLQVVANESSFGAGMKVNKGVTSLGAMNGILLWKRDLKKGFMSYRNTMIG